MPVAFLYHARGLQGMNRRVQGCGWTCGASSPRVQRVVGSRGDRVSAHAAAPVRLDFAGGWTDVPPYSDARRRRGGGSRDSAPRPRRGAGRASGGYRPRLRRTRSQALEYLATLPALASETASFRCCARAFAGCSGRPLHADAPAPTRRPGSGLGSSGALDVAIVAALAAARGAPALDPRGRRSRLPARGGRRPAFPADGRTSSSRRTAGSSGSTSATPKRRSSR